MKRPEKKEWDGEEQCGLGIVEDAYNQALKDMDAWIIKELESLDSIERKPVPWFEIENLIGRIRKGLRNDQAEKEK